VPNGREFLERCRGRYGPCRAGGICQRAEDSDWHCRHTTATMTAGEAHPQSWRHIMGDKGGKKDKEKGQKQKEKEKAKTKQDKLPKSKI
jgi:hypothetical protein